MSDLCRCLVGLTCFALSGGWTVVVADILSFGLLVSWFGVLISWPVSYRIGRLVGWLFSMLSFIPYLSISFVRVPFLCFVRLFSRA